MWSKIVLSIVLFSTLCTNNIQSQCMPNILAGGGDMGIQFVQLGTISNSSTLSNTGVPMPVEDYTATVAPANLKRGSTYSIVVRPGASFAGALPTDLKAWIDWDTNSTFADPTELITNLTFIKAYTNIIDTFTVPMTASLGTTRLRIRTGFALIGGAITPCGDRPYGETEDYLVNIVSASSSNMTISSVTTFQTTRPYTIPNAENVGVIGVQINTTGALNPLNVDSIKLTTNGTTNPACDIDSVKLLFAGNYVTSAVGQQYGTTKTNPMGVLSFIDNQTLMEGENNFILAYDISSNAILGNLFDGTSIEVGINGALFTPTITNPTGSMELNGNCGVQSTAIKLGFNDGSCVGDLKTYAYSAMTVSWFINGEFLKRNQFGDNVYGKRGIYKLQAIDTALGINDSICIYIGDVITPAYNQTTTAQCNTIDFTDQSTVAPGGACLDSYLNGLERKWNFGDGNIEFAKNPTHQFKLNSNYTVRLTLTDSLSGCTNSIEQNLTTSDGPSIDFNTVSGCPCNNIDFSLITSMVNARWDFGDGDTIWGLNPSHTYTKPG